MFPDKGRKRPYVSSKGLLNLKSLITQNALSINKSQKQNDDQIEEKRQKKSQVYPTQNVIREYLTKSNRNKLSNRRFITTK
jgi:predicted nucleic acid binding AN1-type Zn finger protein